MVEAGRRRMVRRQSEARFVISFLPGETHPLGAVSSRSLPGANAVVQAHAGSKRLEPIALCAYPPSLELKVQRGETD
jgi:hypothetical protein